jgi:hypothetical protein
VLDQGLVGVDRVVEVVAHGPDITGSCEGYRCEPTIGRSCRIRACDIVPLRTIPMLGECVLVAELIVIGPYGPGVVSGDGRYPQECAVSAAGR